MRANLIQTYKGKNKEFLLVSSPVDFDFESFILACAMNLLKTMLKSKYPTTLEEDYKLIEQGNHPYRMKIALIHRINQKEILEY